MFRLGESQFFDETKTKGRRRKNENEAKRKSMRESFGRMKLSIKTFFSVFRSFEKVFHLTEAFHKHTLTSTLFYVKYVRIHLVKRAVGALKIHDMEINFEMLFLRWRPSSEFFSFSKDFLVIYASFGKNFVFDFTFELEKPKQLEEDPFQGFFHIFE